MRVLSSYALAAIVLLVAVEPASGRQCTVFPQPNNDSATTNTSTSNITVTPVSTGSGNSTNEESGVNATFTTTPQPQDQTPSDDSGIPNPWDAQDNLGSVTPPEVPDVSVPDVPDVQVPDIQDTPISGVLSDGADKIADDLAILNDTIVAITHQDLFPSAQFPEEVEKTMAAILMLTGLGTCFFGQRFAQPIFCGLALIGGTVISMYPIDIILGDALCGELPCVEGGPEEEFCGWAAFAGLGMGMIFAGGAARIFTCGVLAIGAACGFLPALLAQPFMENLLHDKEQWTHYIHYPIFMAIGAGVSKVSPEPFLIALTSIIGSILTGTSTSYFADGSMSFSDIARGSPSSCRGKCIAIACGTAVLAILSAAFQWRQKLKKDKLEDGSFAEEMLNESLSAQGVLMRKIADRERAERELISHYDTVLQIGPDEEVHPGRPNGIEFYQNSRGVHQSLPRRQADTLQDDEPDRQGRAGVLQKLKTNLQLGSSQ